MRALDMTNLFDKRVDEMKHKKRNVSIVVMIIVIYTIVGILLPFLFRHVLFKGIFSDLGKNDWAGFLGSYVGGVLGGLGTLISVCITVKESRDMQIENKKDTDQKILDDKKERAAERKENQRLREQEKRKQFAEDLAPYVGKYITYISKYFYASAWAEKIDKELRKIKSESEQNEREIAELSKDIMSTENSTEESKQLVGHLEELLVQKKNIEKRYNEKLKEKERNSIECNRIEANECYFILKTKLFNIREANEMLYQMDVLHNGMFDHLENLSKDWLGENSKLFMDKYHKFKTEFEKESF